MGSIDLLPNISIVVIGKNEEKLIHECFSSLIHLDYPHDAFEIIYVDHASTDNTMHVVNTFLDQHPNYTITTYSNTTPYIAHSRNIGVQHAHGTFIAFTDADCTVPRDWLQVYIKKWQLYELQFGKKLAALGGGNIVSHSESSLFRHCLQYVLSTYIGTGGSLTGMRVTQDNVVKHIPTANVFYKKDILLSYPFYSPHPTCGEDLSLSCALRKQGYIKIALADSVVLHHGPDTLLDWVKTTFTYGQTRILISVLHEIYSEPFFILGVLIFASLFMSISFLSLWMFVFIYLTLVLFYLGLLMWTSYPKKEYVGRTYKIWGYTIFLYMVTHGSYLFGVFCAFCLLPTFAFRIRNKRYF